MGRLPVKCVKFIALNPSYRMKNVFYLLLLFLVSVKVSAQNEFLNKNNSIKPLNSGSTMNPGSGSTTPSVYTPNVFNTPKPSTSNTGKIPGKQVDMSSDGGFQSPGNDLYKDKLNEKTQKDIEGLTLDRPSYRHDMDMGTFETSSEYVTVYSRDYSEIDGDWVKGWHNDVVVAPAILLDQMYGRGLKIYLTKGKNVIAMEAMNVGAGFPNTAQFMVKDDKGDVLTSNYWALDIGFKAIININKK